MKPITLELLETKHKEFGELIEKFKAEVKTQYVFPEIEIQLAHGEHYAGAIINPDGTGNHVILLAGDKNDGNWQEAIDWAASIGGWLPTRREQSLLFANLKEEFQEKWYWSSDQPASDSGYAWSQVFYNGEQYDCNEDSPCRARAVRRLPI